MLLQGFSNHLYDLFYDGKTGKPHPKPLVGSQRQRIFLTTPKVRAVARQHFSCELLPGAPLEDELGAPYSHWEQSLMNVSCLRNVRCLGLPPVVFVMNASLFLLI